jgi:predicted metal-dependent hydrolase
MYVKNEIDIENYSVRVSSRAKKVWIKISEEKGLEIVIPKNFSRKKIPEIINNKKEWIERHLIRLKKKKQNAPVKELKKPETVDLKAIGQIWKIQYRKTPYRGLWILSNKKEQILALDGNIDNEALCIKAVKQWLTNMAKHYLQISLDEACKETGFEYTKITVRGQKSKWASCSHKKAISLNIKLLLIDPELVRYIMVHELCHTKHLNHSKRYWHLVSNFISDYKKCNKELRESWKAFDPWVHH